MNLYIVDERISVHEEAKISNKWIGKRFVPPQKAIISSVVVLFFFFSLPILFLFNIFHNRNIHWLFLHCRFTVLKLYFWSLRHYRTLFFLSFRLLQNLCVRVSVLFVFVCVLWESVCVYIVLIRLFAPHIFTLHNNNILIAIKFRSVCIYAVHFGSVSYFFSTFYFEFILRLLILFLILCCYFFRFAFALLRSSRALISQWGSRMMKRRKEDEKKKWRAQLKTILFQWIYKIHNTDGWVLV